MFSAVYAEGVAPHSPGLTALAGYPGNRELKAISTPKGLCQTGIAEDGTPSGYGNR